MDQDALATLQAPLKASYPEDPDAALVILHASGRLGEGVACSLDTGRAPAEAGLHPAAGGERSFRGTLAVSKDAPVGFREIRIDVDLDTDASDRELAALTKITGRYCVVWQSLRQPPEGSVSISRVG